MMRVEEVVLTAKVNKYSCSNIVLQVYKIIVNNCQTPYSNIKCHEQFYCGVNVNVQLQLIQHFYLQQGKLYILLMKSLELSDLP